MTSSGYVVALTTTDSEQEAVAIAQALIERKLAACVQRIPIVSHYRWEGEATTGAEILLLVKTRQSKVDAIKEYVETHHSYDTPELVVLPISSGLPGYLAWIDSVTS